MSVLKTVGVLGTISGIGLVGYYFLNKTKPNIAKQQAFDIKGEGYVLPKDKEEYRIYWAKLAQYSYDNIAKQNSTLDLKVQLLTQKPLIITQQQLQELSRAENEVTLLNIQDEVLGKNRPSRTDNNFEKRTKTIEDISLRESEMAFRTKCDYNPSKGEKNPCGYTYKPIEGYTPLNKPFASQLNFEAYYKYAPNEFQGYFWKLPNPSGEDISIGANNCVELDRDIKRLIDRIADQTKKNPNENLRRVLYWYKSILEDYSELNQCRDKIEKQRALDIAKTATLSSIDQEKSVLGKSQKNENLYLVVGASVLVIGLGIVLTGGNSSK